MSLQITTKARHPIWMALCLGFVLIPGAARTEEAAAAAPAQVKIDNFAFTPATLNVKAGTTVTFVNHDDIPHSVVGGDGTFRSKALDTDDSFLFTFKTPGEFGYFCGLHPHMIGKVVVVP
jgi:plastocyanin